MAAAYAAQPIFLPGLPGASPCHAPTLVEGADGDLLAAWFGGPHEGHPDVAIWLARGRGRAWQPPVRVADLPGVPLWNPVLFCDTQQVLWLFYKVGPSVPAWTGAYLQSADHGLTWSPPTYLPAGLLGPAKNKPIQLSNGAIACGSSAETWRAWACWVEISDDGGLTWQKRGPIAALADLGDMHEPVSAPVSARWDPRKGELILPDAHAGVIQPTLWEYAPGRLKMLMRATRRIGRICQAVSDDYGQMWSAALPTDLPNPNSGLDAVRLDDGRIALVFNPSVDSRTPLAIALSADNGETWPHRRLLADGPGEYSYPAIIQARDGALHVAYTDRRRTIQHVVLSPDWIQEG